MTEWFYLALGFALLFVLYRGEEPQPPQRIWVFSLTLLLALAILLALDTVTTAYLWQPMGRRDLRLVSLFLWALVIDESMERLKIRGRKKGEIRVTLNLSLLALISFALGTIGKEGTLAGRGRFLWGLALPLGAGLAEWLLEGLKERLRLSRVPEALRGMPILFWLAMLLSLTLKIF